MTLFIIWRVTPQGELEDDLRALYPQLTGETIQDAPEEDVAGEWRLVGTSRLNDQKVQAITALAEQQLAVYRTQGLAADEDTLDMYLVISETVPDWFIPVVDAYV